MDNDNTVIGDPTVSAAKRVFDEQMRRRVRGSNRQMRPPANLGPKVTRLKMYADVDEYSEKFHMVVPMTYIYNLETNTWAKTGNGSSIEKSIELADIPFTVRRAILGTINRNV